MSQVPNLTEERETVLRAMPNDGRRYDNLVLNHPIRL
jgi:hypothetical protein